VIRLCCCVPGGATRGAPLVTGSHHCERRGRQQSGRHEDNDTGNAAALWLLPPPSADSIRSRLLCDRQIQIRLLARTFSSA
jgi:hypothetical protein